MLLQNIFGYIRAKNYVKINVLEKDQHELHLWIYYMSKFLNTSEFIIEFIIIKNSRHLTLTLTPTPTLTTNL
jgi:hypothetical protein